MPKIRKAFVILFSVFLFLAIPYLGKKQDTQALFQLSEFKIADGYDFQYLN